MSHKHYAWYRFNALSKKEITQLLRDRITFVYILLSPLLEIIIFSLVFNSDPRHLPTAVLDFDPSPYTRTIVQGLQNTSYFDITQEVHNEAEAQKLLATGAVQFVISIPENFSQDLVRGKQPQIALEADATNPLATNNALNTAVSLQPTVLQDMLQGPLEVTNPKPTSAPFQFVIDPKFNPERRPQFFSIPGLIGILTSAALLGLTLISLTREKESGTMESLITTPTTPLEVILSKIFPSIIIGYIQLTLMLLATHYMFDLPFNGSITILYIAAFFFLMSNLLTGLFISSFASSQFQALQLAALYLMPNIFFSGFTFPFRGMPVWGQWVGEILPVTHFIRIMTGLMLKGNNFFIIWHDIWPMIVFSLVIIALMVMMFRQTLD